MVSGGSPPALARAIEEPGLWGVVGLLSSSCCALQLVLNAFSVGCAGFNTVLGPLRPYLLALASVLQVLYPYLTLTLPSPYPYLTLTVP